MIPAQNRLELFRKMLLIRRVQETIERRYLEDHMRSPVHLCIGQEAISAGFCHALHRDDYISSNHRGHGHYLAKGGGLNALIAELHCRKTGCSEGYGGSMHLVDRSVGHLGSSSIVGGGISIGTGMALALKMQSSQAVSTVFFGDGAADEGVLYESLNFAILKKLPVIYVLENNGWAVCSPVSSRQVGKNVFHGGTDPADLLTEIIDGNDPEVVYGTAQRAVQRARCGDGPSFIECTTYRIMGHAGCKAQDADGYRDEREVAAWHERCPVNLLRSRLLKEGILTLDEEMMMEDDIRTRIEEAFSFAMKSPLPSADDLHNNLFCE